MLQVLIYKIQRCLVNVPVVIGLLHALQMLIYEIQSYIVNITVFIGHLYGLQVLIYDFNENENLQVTSPLPQPKNLKVRIRLIVSIKFLVPNLDEASLNTALISLFSLYT